MKDVEKLEDPVVPAPLVLVRPMVMVSKLLMIDVANLELVPVLVAVLKIVIELAFVYMLVCILVPPVFVPVVVFEPF